MGLDGINLSNITRPLMAIAERHGGDIIDASKKMETAKLRIEVGTGIHESYHYQVALLTLINISSRVFRGGIHINLPKEITNLTNRTGETLNSLIEPKLVDHQDTLCDFTIMIGVDKLIENSCKVLCNNWQGGIQFPNDENIRVEESNGRLPFGAVAAASIACFEAFDSIYSMTDRVVKSNQGISLWNINTSDWSSSANKGVNELDSTPNKFWFLGLGHLGQAYLWLLSFIEFPNPSEIKILLQDYDVASESNLGSQVLTSVHDIGKLKTRIASEFLESFGIQTRLVEKPFETVDQKTTGLKDFKILLNGLDNVETRRQLLPDQFDFILDGATNGQEYFFDSFTLNVLDPNSENPEKIWNSESSDDVTHRKIFDYVEKHGGCGEITSHGISTPFVGCFGASILLSELYKKHNSIDSNSFVSVEMRNILKCEVY